MLLGLHTGSILYTNLVTDIRVAREAGYDAVEVTMPKLLRYLDAGYDAGQIPPQLGGLSVAMINSFLHIERQEPEFRQRLRAQCLRLWLVPPTFPLRNRRRLREFAQIWRAMMAALSNRRLTAAAPSIPLPAGCGKRCKGTCPSA